MINYINRQYTEANLVKNPEENAANLALIILLDKFDLTLYVYKDKTGKDLASELEDV